MKKIMLLIATFIFCHCLPAQHIQEVLKDTDRSFSPVDSVQKIADAAKRFERIADKCPDVWTALYYAAYAHILLSYSLEDEKVRDAVIDKAENEFTKAKALFGKETDEMLVMEAYIANARLAVKPLLRHREYGAIFDNKLETAAKINPQNPRIYLLKGQSTFHTPKAFGGGDKRALPHFEKAATLFAAEAKDDLAKPFRGEEMNRCYINECKR
jgi:hypothetical protein